jgi:hypothetical protein
MRHLRTSCLLALLLAFLPVLALASEQHKSITLDQKAEIGSQQLKPGRYTMKFDDSSQAPTVQFIQDGKTVATAQAQIQHKQNPENAQYEFNTASGQNRLDRVYLGHNEELAFGARPTN